MANALSFVGSGSASVPNYVWNLGGNSSKAGLAGAVEFYLQTTSTHQTLFSASTTFAFERYTGASGFVLALDEEGCVTFQGTQILSGFPTIVVYRTATAVNDGKWHQISIYSPGGGWSLYIDGVAVKFVQAPETELDEAEQDLELGDGFAGSIYFGEDKFNATPWAPAYRGLMSEIRVWKGGSPLYILTPAFSLNVGVPVASNTPNLGLYWPFWTNQEQPLIDKVAKTALVLNGQSIATDVGQYYNDLSEVLCNGTMAAFDPFTVGTTGAAFTYVLSQADLAGYTPASFRAIYTQQSYALAFSGWQGDIRNAKYPGTNGATNDFTQADFTHVQGVLVKELEGVVLVWGFYQAAYDNLGFVAAQYNNAAATVYTTLMATSIQIANPVASSLDSIFNGVAAAGGAVPEYGPIISGAIKVAGTVISFSQPDQSPYIDFSTTLKIEAQASKLESAVNTVIGDMYGAISTSLAIILRNSGLLNLVASRVNQGETFEFGPDLNPQTNPDLGGLLAVYNAAILLFTQTVLCNSFPIYTFDSTLPGGSYPLAYTFHIQDGPFNEIWGQGISPYTGVIVSGGQAVIGTCVEDGFHGFPEFTTLSTGAGGMLRAAATALNGQVFQQGELYGWPFHVQSVC